MGRHSDPNDPADQPEDHEGDPQGGHRSDEQGFDEPGFGAGYGETPYEGTEYAEPSHAEPNYLDDDYWQAQREDGDQDAFPTHSFASETPPPVSGPQHSGEWDGGEWTGSHRAVQTGRRGISIGVIAALVTVVAVVGAIILWRFFGDALSNRSQAAAARCVEGEVAVAVIADPSIADKISTIAEKYNQTADPVGDKCVKVGVRPAGSDQVVSGFVGKWPDSEMGEQPALWIPGSSVSEARLEAASGAQIVSDSRSLVTSPVLLAVRPQLKTALAQKGWSAMPPLQTNPKALDDLNLPGWGALRLALPLAGDGDATFVAAEAVASASAPPGSSASAGTSAINTLVAGQPSLADDKVSTAMDALLAGSDPATSSVHAVLTTEQQLFQRGAALPDAKAKLAGWTPSGPAAIADYPTVLLSGSWLSQDQVSAASEFARFLRKPEAMSELGSAGFRTDDGTPPPSDVTDFGPISAPVSVGDNATRATLADAVSSPAQSSAVTIMLDQSMSAGEGGQSRTVNVALAIDERLRTLPPAAAVGLWTFDGVAGRSDVALGPLGDSVGGQPRSAVLTGSLKGQFASDGGAVSFTTLRALYTEAVANYREGQENSVLVITAGPHTDQSLDGSGLQDVIRQTFEQAKPVAINVLDFGADPDRATWEAVSQSTGGTYQNLASSTGPELPKALTTMLG